MFADAVGSTEIGKLRGGQRTPRTGPQVDFQIGRIIREIVSRIGAAIPDRHEDLVAAWCTLPYAIDEFLSGIWIPGVDGLNAKIAEISAVELLDCGDVVHHQGLSIISNSVGVTGVGGSADIGPITRNGVLHRFMLGGQRGALDIVLEA